MKKLAVTLCLLLVFVTALSPVSLAAGENTDTLFDWDIKVTVPEGKTAVLKGDEYYIYADKTGYIPYVMLRTFRYDSVEDFIPAFTKYMREQHSELIVTGEDAEKVIGDKRCHEIDYSYLVSGYEIKDRRVAILHGGRIYLFTSKELEELGQTVGTMLEDVIADCVFLTQEPDAYLYCLADGTPKYWLDFSNKEAEGPVLHCYFRSGDPTFYESRFYLDGAEEDGDSTVYRKVVDAHGFDHSDWFRRLAVRPEGEGLILEVEREESTLAGGTEDNVLSGSYAMEPVGVRTRYEYRQKDGMLKYWLDLSKPAIELHTMFRSGEPEFHEEVFTVDPDTAQKDGEYTLVVGKLLNERGIDVSDWFKSLTLTEVQGALIMTVKRDERTLAGGEDDNILSGSYLFEPKNGLRPAHDGPFTPEELCRWAQIRYFTETGFFPPEADFEKNNDGSYTIHLYEIVDLDAVTHTATSAWYSVDENGDGTDDINGTPVHLAA